MAKLGFAFSFGARDDGMGRAMSSALDSITKINKGLGQQNALASSGKLAGALKAVAGGAGKAAMGVGGMAKGMAGAFSLGIQNRVNSFNLASMAQNIRGLTEDSGNLSNSMESIGASYAQQARPALALMGVTGAELKKLTGQASGMAYGMNVGVETVVKTMGALRNAGKASKSVFDELGMSTQEFVKLAEGTGMATEQLGQLGGDLVASWGFTGKEAKQTLEYMVAMGNQGGIGAQMFTQMGDQMNGLNAILAKQVSTHMRSAQEIKGTVEASVRLAGAYHAMGLSGEEASKAASETSNKFLEWQVAIERANLGLGPMPDVFDDLSSVVGGTQQAMDLIALGAQDSTAGMKQFAQYMQTARDSGKTLDAAVLGKLTESFGEAGSNAVYLALSTTQGADALEKMRGATVKADGALKKFANDSYSSGRTLQEGLDMAKEAFMTRVRSITRPEVRGFVREQIQSYKELGTQAKQMASDATWGPLIKAYSIFDQMGTKGVILHFGKQLGMNTKEANKFAIGMDVAIDAIGKVQQSFAPLFETLGMGPLAGVAGGIAAWFMLPQEDRDKIYKTFEPVIIIIKQKLGELWDGFTARMGAAWDSINWQGLIDKAKPALAAFATTVGEMFQKIFPKLAEFLGIGEALQKAKDERARIAQAKGISAGAAEAATKYGESLKQQKLAEIAQREGRSRALTPEEQMGVSLEAAAKGKALAEAQKRMMVLKESGYGASALAMAEGEQARKMAAKSTANANQIAFAGEMAMGERITAEMGKRMVAGDIQGLKQINPSMAAVYETTAGLPVVGGIASKFMQGKMFEASEEYGQRGVDWTDAIQGQRKSTGTVGLGAMAPAVPATLSAIQTQFDAKQAELATAAQKSGTTVTEMLAEGLAVGTEKTLEPQIVLTTQAIAAYLPQSEPKVGPLAGGMLSNAGSGMLELVMQGIQGAQYAFETGFATVLEESVTFAIDAFQAKALEEFKNSPIQQEIFGKITAQYAGILTEDDKKILKSSLDMSGLYGVINAVVLDGAETRKVLVEIKDNTAGLKGWTPGAGSGWAQIPQGNGAAAPPPK